MEFSRYTRRTLITVSLLFAFILAALVLRQVVTVLLLLFAGILLAVLLGGLTTKLCEQTSLPRGWGLSLVLVLLVAFVVGAGGVAGPRVDDQVAELGKRIPSAIEEIRASLSQYSWGRSLMASSPNSKQTLSVVAGGLTNAVGAITSAVVVLVTGLYLAVAPSTYIDGALRLVPAGRRERGHEIVRVVGRALRWWLVGRVASMGVVGALTAAGLWISGIPLAFALGLIAALLSFVPYIGPIVSTIPAALVALADSPSKVFYVFIVYAAVQFLESNLITPLIQKRTVSIPPAVLIGAQTVMGVLVGAIGVFIATPLAVVCIVLIQMIYIEDVLGETITPLGARE